MINKILNGDCLELMQDIPDKSIDMILCDLPYGVLKACKWDVIIPFGELWEQYERVIKDNGSILLTASQPFTTDLIMSNRKLFRYELIWEKSCISSPMLANKRILPKHENILIFYKKQPTYNPQKTYCETNRSRNIKESSILPFRGEGCYGDFIRTEKQYDKSRFPHSVLKFKNPPRNNQFIKNLSIHPTQKPVELFEYLIKTYTNEGMTVLDNCSGSGTTAIACINTNRNYICIEKDKTYFDLSIERVTKHTQQMELISC